ncbi:MAG: metal-dependent hydrolase [Pirellulaceae bacterium]|nr:metal-dependent hydrolase [Pirellulaceae bacterium]
MADFKTHITFSSMCGAVYSVAGYRAGVPLEACIVAGGLCSVSGMLPDLDSDSGIPLREAVALSSAVVPMLMVDRLNHVGYSHETMVMITGLIYVLIRFGVAEVFRRYTVHRGMWHSIPAALTSGMIAFMLCTCENMSVRLFKSLAVVIGFMSHLILDEMWSVDFKRGSYRFKSSFGTALKFWGKERFPNLIAYSIMMFMAILVYNDRGFMERFNHEQPNSQHTATEVIKDLWANTQAWLTR